jgi:Ca2+-binding RTX toxin-like protein
MWALVILSMSLLAPPIQADFVQCAGNVQCDGTANSDIINGTDLFDDIFGLNGDDVIFANGGNDTVEDEDGNSVIFGGTGSDKLEGSIGNDVLFPGPDVPEFGQGASGSQGNDTINVLVSDTGNCLIIYASNGNDVVNLLGFGPYIATAPWGLATPEGWVHVVDPIAGGDIYIRVHENDAGGVEQINGLLSANLTLINDDADTEVDNCNASLPGGGFI